MKSTSAQFQLKRTVEEQLDLILKIDEERKILKRQNKSLNQKYLKLTETLKKYSNSEKYDKATATEALQKVSVDHQTIQASSQTSDRGCQIDIIQQQNFNTLNNTSKLSEAMQFLKAIDTSTIQQNLSRTNQDSIVYGSRMNILQNQTLRTCQDQTIKQVKQEKNKQKNQQISNEIVKMSKEIASLKRQLKDSEAKHKQREKQFKQIKRCLQTKSEALQKSRKQFNQLSMLLNTDKYKSVRNLQSENQKLRTKASKIDDQAGVIQSLKKMLQSTTGEYSAYREEKQKKINLLIKELKDKDHAVEDLEVQVGQLKNELNLIKF